MLVGRKASILLLGLLVGISGAAYWANGKGSSPRGTSSAEASPKKRDIHGLSPGMTRSEALSALARNGCAPLRNDHAFIHNAAHRPPPGFYGMTTCGLATGADGRSSGEFFLDFSPYLEGYPTLTVAFMFSSSTSREDMIRSISEQYGVRIERGVGDLGNGLTLEIDGGVLDRNWMLRLFDPRLVVASEKLKQERQRKENPAPKF